MGYTQFNRVDFEGILLQELINKNVRFKNYSAKQYIIKLEYLNKPTYLFAKKLLLSK